VSDERPRFRRPWEEPVDEEPADGESAPGGQTDEPAPDHETKDEAVPPEKEPSQPAGSDPPAGEDVDLTDWEAMASGPSGLDDMDHGAYVGATTEEYRGLAEEINRLRNSEFERQAVSATMAGVDTGLVGFEDVTGERGVTEEDVEAMEQARSSDLALRIGSAVLLVALLLGSLYLGGWWFTAFLTLIMLISLGEFYSTLRRTGYAPLALVGLLGIIAAPILIHSNGIYSLAGVTLVATVIVALAYSLAHRRHPLENASLTVFGMVWVALLAFAIPVAASPHPVAYIIMVGLVTAMIDIGSYFVGRGFGSRPLAPILSPNKTIEGFFGGVVAALVTAAVLSTLPAYEELGFAGSVILATILAVIAPVGDLAESMVKRSLGVKDMGSVLPGHGGMLDRIDSFLFAVPAAYVFLLLRDLL
jgi:phosphatidate cytidylyltransferase